MQERFHGIVSRGIGAARVLADGAASVIDMVRGRDRAHPDIEADAGDRSPPAERLSDDPAYEPDEELKRIKGS